MELAHLAEQVLRHPGLRTITVSQLLLFITLCSNLKRSIQLVQPARYSSAAAPTFLPPSITYFLAKATLLPAASIGSLWQLLKNVVWATPGEQEHQQETARLFKTHGLQHDLSLFMIYPPSNHCQNPNCTRATELHKAEARQVVVHTLAHGTQPAWAVHLYCTGCHSNYHPNYYVHAGQHTYYPGVPSFLQVSEHHFVEHRLAELWTNQTLFSACSALNCSKIFMFTFAQDAREEFQAIGWSFGPTLTTEHVWDTFVLLALLRDQARRGLLLTLPHTGLQKDRFVAAMQERNERIVYHGQPEITHYCDGCMRVYEDTEDASILRKCQVVVSDGITLGHPCCGESRCTKPLPNIRHRFCRDHSGLHDICAVRGCKEPCVEGSKTCADTTHRAMEAKSIAKGKSVFALSERLLRQRISRFDMATIHANDRETDDLEENYEWFTLEGGVLEHHFEKNAGCVGVSDGAVEATQARVCPTKSNDGNRKLKAQFGRRRTHNEQTLVRPCGIIITRATFFGASNVLDFVRKVFSVPGAQKPEHFIYDTACDAKQQVEARNDEWWKGVGMCVDVWHFLNKHKTTHEYCQKHCNPADYPELMAEDGNGWWFNTSVAEQINVWLGGYHAICREMLPVKYNFFLDELIRLHNIVTLHTIQGKGWNPHYSPTSFTL